MANLASGGVTVVGIGTNLLIPSLLLTTGSAATDVGLPISQDTTAANRGKPAADGDLILGILQSYEDRVQEGIKMGAVAMKGGFRLQYKSGDAVAIGDSVVSAGGGEVKTTATRNNTRVFSKDATNLTVDVLFT